jgi:hypothetical protein
MYVKKYAEIEYKNRELCIHQPIGVDYKQAVFSEIAESIANQV